MEHGAGLSTSRVIAIAFIFMSVLIVLSLSVNVIQGVNGFAPIFCRQLLSLNPLLACCRRYSRGER